MTQLTLDPKYLINNFHNQPAITVRVKGQPEIDAAGRTIYKISRRQARRIESHFCGVTECHCAKGGYVIGLDAEGEQFGIDVTDD
jgi:hypothetical protein